MIGGVLELGERRVHEVMVARVDIVALPVDASLDEIVRDHRDRGPLAHPGLRRQHRQHRRPPLRQGPAARTSSATTARRPSAACCGRRSSCPSRCSSTTCCTACSAAASTSPSCSTSTAARPGLVSIEDLIEEIVGEIQDEYDEEEPMIVPLGDDEARVDGRADVDDLLEHFDSRLESDDKEEFDTVGGLVYHYMAAACPRSATPSRWTACASPSRRPMAGACAPSTSSAIAGPRASRPRSTQADPGAAHRPRDRRAAPLIALRADGGPHDAGEPLEGLAVDERRGQAISARASSRCSAPGRACTRGRRPARGCARASSTSAAPARCRRRGPGWRAGARRRRPWPPRARR